MVADGIYKTVKTIEDSIVYLVFGGTANVTGGFVIL